MLRSAQRRTLAIDLGPAARAGATLGAPVPDDRWIHAIPDGLALPTADGPEEMAVQRETIRLAFVAALQHLPPRQRAFYERLLGAVPTSRYPADGPVFFIGLKIGDSELGLVNSASRDVQTDDQVWLPGPRRQFTRFAPGRGPVSASR